MRGGREVGCGGNSKAVTLPFASLPSVPASAAGLPACSAGVRGAVSSWMLVSCTPDSLWSFAPNAPRQTSTPRPWSRSAHHAC
jgi:hypothetical protein